MTLGEKLSKLRKSNNYTQEQLAGILGVSRQAVGKWESDNAYPETEKLIRMSELFGCSLDYLLKDELETEQKPPTEKNIPIRKRVIRERRSQRMIGGVSLWHVGKRARGIVAVGMDARGIVAVGLNARGILSFGLLSAGLFAYGLLSLGILAIGMAAVGLFSAGCFSVGIVSAGAISFGVVSLGAIAVGKCSAGALAVGKYIAVGDHARAMIAVGETQASGSLYRFVGTLTPQNVVQIQHLIEKTVPSYLQWAANLIMLFL